MLVGLHQISFGIARRPLMRGGHAIEDALAIAAARY